jgi:hypothetical protein
MITTPMLPTEAMTLRCFPRSHAPQIFHVMILNQKTEVIL